MPKIYTSWCQNLIATLNEGGIWAVPRSGLVFKKAGNTLKLVDTIPEVASKEEQVQDFLEIQHFFKEAGIEVTR